MFHRSLLAGCSASVVFRDFSKPSSISTEAVSMRVIRLAVNSFSDLPSMTANQPMAFHNSSFLLGRFASFHSFIPQWD